MEKRFEYIFLVTIDVLEHLKQPRSSEIGVRSWGMTKYMDSCFRRNDRELSSPT